jgi:DNA mismatch repair ATPase MutS
MYNNSFYQNRINEYSANLSRMKRFNPLFIILKITLFIAILVMLYYWMVHQTSILWALGCIVSFAVVFKLDLRFMRRLKLLEALLRINENEKRALGGDLSCFDDGIRYQNTEHPYAFDLDLFGKGSLFQFLNRTVTQEGADQLVHYLTEMITDSDEILQRQAAIVELAPMVEWRQMFGAIGHGGGMSLKGLVSHLQSTAENPKPESKLRKGLAYMMIAITLAAVLLSLLGMAAYQLPLMLIISQLLIWGMMMKSTNAIHHKVEACHKVFVGYHDLLMHLKDVESPFESPKLQHISQGLTSSRTGAIEAFGELGLILNSFNQRSNLLVSMVFNGLLLRDMMLVMRYHRWMNRWAGAFPQWSAMIAELDTLVSLANYAYNHPDFCMPQPCNNVVLESVVLGHPLIDAKVRVCNDYRVGAMHHFHLVTGANMAGKSTFLRTVGVNLLLASCGAPVCADSFRFKPMKLFSSMRTSDNLVNHTSYFQAELLRLKKLIDTAASGDGLFVILDEILKGTNSRDKLAGSRLFLLRMLDFNASGMVATHDLALGELEQECPGHFANICFEITIGKDEIIYDYRLKAGLAHNLNATWLLERLIG